LLIGNSLVDRVVGFDLGEWPTPSAGGAKKAFCAGALSWAVERSAVFGTFFGELPAAARANGHGLYLILSPMILAMGQPSI